MAIQIFGSTKNFDTKKAQMWFSERRIPFQFVNIAEKPISRGEFDSILQNLAKTFGSKDEAIEHLIDKGSKDYASIAYLDDDDKADKLFECQKLLKMPLIRNGKTAATVGFEPKTWESWKA